jgi:hypothetical protein
MILVYYTFHYHLSPSLDARHPAFSRATRSAADLLFSTTLLSACVGNEKSEQIWLIFLISAKISVAQHPQKAMSPGPHVAHVTWRPGPIALPIQRKGPLREKCNAHQRIT